MSALFEFLCRQGDSTLILGQRLGEWCGHAPALEEDIALANVALDLIGQTQMWLGLATEVEGAVRDADDLAMRRDVWDFRNLLLVEQPNGDFGQTTMRQWLFDQFHVLQLERLCDSADDRVAAIAAKAVKEVRYHLERSSGTVIALGDGTEESHGRMQAALDRLWPYAGEMFESDAIDAELAEAGIAPEPADLRAPWDVAVDATLAEATLTRPESDFTQTGGRSGKRHSEHLGHLLAQMQWLPRAYPDARW
ncbi:1,2-phenylacetyl-CoA epoxidase subunit PaaC [Jannaschia aquimarina]|uniref:PaaC protein n=1 Tax=Jannaschia aquimarina TaxID=935700 RepID=A0A0D1EM43_9RHOB|nr:1,2-phenylacetyl-CoA epoxidase subunit PaaC [Jannaschia aquimarina]KIT16775.1 1,2-phenylacetyl-CoA epoxidase, subunit C [Jannaschia aquimarina]SNS52673.1 ring-1,2-phenylacetyl-CoA epoxidase subunit PaaC [Jannaschia aquimarina]